MDFKVYPGKLKGTVKAPPSKSMAHRLIIAASLASGVSVISGISGSDDIEATISCMEGLGAHIERNSNGQAAIKGIAGRFPDKGDGEKAFLDCNESGSTLRFLLPVAAALGVHTLFMGRGRLPERPMTPLADEMKKKGILFIPNNKDKVPFTITGKLEPGVYELPGNVSSQYVSGLLFALPLLEGNSEIRITGELESSKYVDLTVSALSLYGIRSERSESGFIVKGGQNYVHCDSTVEGDWSNAAFWEAANACGSEIVIDGLDENSLQGDRAVRSILSEIRSGDRDVVNCSEIPDIIPALAVSAAAGNDVIRFVNAGRLRIKESDRLAAVAECLSRLGVRVDEQDDELTVIGGGMKGGCELDCYNDHRIAMSMAIAALSCEEPVVIKGAESVNKSYPDFFDVFRELGGRADVISDR